MWMRAEEDLPPATVRDVRVALGRAEIGMAEHLLDAPEVGAALEQVRGEGVPEQVRVDAPRLQARLLRKPAQDQERSGASSGPPRAFRKSSGR